MVIPMYLLIRAGKVGGRRPARRELSSCFDTVEGSAWGARADGVVVVVGAKD